MKGIEQLMVRDAPAVRPAKTKPVKPPRLVRPEPVKRSRREVCVGGCCWMLETGVSMRETKTAEGVVYPFAEMKPGEAVFIAFDRWRTNALIHAHKLPGRQFRARRAVSHDQVAGYYVFRCK